jgi:uncharacterized protein (TIGR02246 family)
MIAIDTAELDRIVSGALDTWADAVRAHEPERAASYFTEDAIFQGFDRTHTVGRPGITAYYDKQPLGLSPTFEILERRQLSDDTLIAYVDVDFARPDGVVIPVHLTAVLVHVDGVWLISYYHVSKIEA